MNVATLSRNLVLLKALEEAVADFRRAAVPCLVLKGGALALHLYPSPDLRPMEDVDLLVPAELLGPAEDALRRLGYRREPGTPTDWRRGAVKIDLECGLWYLSQAEEKAVWRRAIDLDRDGHRLPAPAWEDHIVFIIAHSAVHHAWWDPVHAEDLQRLLERPLDWGTVGARLRRFRLAAPAAATFRLLGLRPPAPLASALEGASPAAVKLCLEALRRGPLPGMGHLLRWWTAANRSRHLQKLLLPGGAYARDRYGGGFWGSPLLRPFRLAATFTGCLIEAVRLRRDR